MTKSEKQLTRLIQIYPLLILFLIIPLTLIPLQPHKDQLEAIFNRISADEIPPVSGPESLKSLQLVLDVYESSRK